jgi:CHASE3 domain sensor protein
MFKKTQSLSERSSTALGLFNQVIQELNDVTVKSKERQEELSLIKNAIQSELDELSEMDQSNQKVISNIESILK